MVLIFINDIPANLECKVKVFADDISLFSLVHDPNENSANLAETRWVGRLLCGHIKGRYHPILNLLSKLSRFTFSGKINPMDTSPVCFNNLAVASSETNKHLGLFFDVRLAYNRYIEETILTANKGI